MTIEVQVGEENCGQLPVRPIARLVETSREKAENTIEPSSTEPEAKEMHDGMPVLTEDDYLQLCSEDDVDFRGYVRSSKDCKLYYRDIITSSGLLETMDHDGIQVSSEGIADYMDIANRMKAPKEVGEYCIYIKIPSEIQKEKGLVCAAGKCISVEDFKEDWEVEDEAEVLERQNHPESHILIRIKLNPKDDPQAREKMEAIHQKVVQHIEEGGPLDKIRELVKA